MPETGLKIASILESQGGEVYAASADATIGDAAKIMGANNIGLVVVIGGDGGFTGVLSERDIVRVIAEQGADVLTMKVEKFYTRDVVVCAPDDNPHDVLATMNAQGFRHVPVVEDGKVLGIVSLSDVTRYALREIEYAALPIL